MRNPLNLISGQKYKVIKPFTDYDRHVHQVGNTWTFVETNFLPYEDGLTVHLRLDNNPKVLLFRCNGGRNSRQILLKTSGIL